MNGRATDPVLSGGPALEAIAEWSRSVAIEALPPAVVTKAKWLLLDGISWMVMGARHPSARRLLDAVAREVATGCCTLVGSDRRAGLSQAVYFNAALAQVHDCSDVRRLARRDGGANHPGRCVVPVALTLAERHRLPGAALLELIVVGYEIVCRLDAALPDQEYACTVAALASRARAASAGETIRALLLGHLSFPAPCAGFDETDLDFLRNGLIARAALDASACSTAEMDLPFGRAPGLRGALPGRDAGAAEYAISDVAIKPYPCCRALHGAVDLALELRAAHRIDPAAVSGVEVRVGNSKLLVYEPIGPAASHKRAQFSIPYVIACAFLDGWVGEHSFTPERIGAAEVADFQARVRVVRDEKLAYNPVGPAARLRPTSMKVTLTDGTVFTRATLSPRGSPVNPLTEEQLRAKFREWCGPSLTEVRSAAIERAVQGLEELDDTAQLIALLAREA